MKITFKPLKEIPPEKIIALMNDPLVRKHMPLCLGDFDFESYKAFILSKEKIWKEHGFGPFAFEAEGEFLGWGGLQPEGDDIDLALVLHPKHWGLGLFLTKIFLKQAFEELQCESVTILLPPSRSKFKGLLHLGFKPAGELTLEGKRFLRFRIQSSLP